MSRNDDESSLERTVGGALRRWLDKARAAVRRGGPDQIYGLQSDWDDEVDGTILTEIGRIGLAAWSEATDVPAVSRHAFVQAYLADVRSLLVRIPDEVADLVFAEISEGVNAGESRDQIADRVDKVLSYTDSERWPNRAKVIAQTETNRAYGAGTYAAGLEQARVTGKQLFKRWDSRHDDKVRADHRDVKTVPIWQPFMVGPLNIPMQFPGDPSAPPSEVINCRCRMVIVDG